MRSAITLGIVATIALAQVSPSPPKKPGSVEGTVANSVTGQPIKKAIVTLHNYRRFFASVAVSDAEGHFKIMDVEPGDSYGVTAECPGFTTDNSRAASGFSVGEEQAVNGISVKLAPLGVIAGKVVDEDGDPLPGVSVQAIQVSYRLGSKEMRAVRNAQTDDRGEYRLFDLPVGRTFVVATPREHVQPVGNARFHRDHPEQWYAQTFYPASQDPGGATPTAIAPGTEASGVDFRLRKVPVYHIRGKAVDALSGEPVHGASLEESLCGLTSPSAGLRRSIQLPPDGNFDLSGAVPGLYCLYVNQSQSGLLSFGRETVTVSGQDMDHVVVSVVAAGDMPGSVEFEGNPPAQWENVRVAIRSVDGRGSGSSANIKSDRTFVLPNVLPAQYEVWLAALPDGFWLKSIEFANRDASEGRINVTAPETPLTLTITSGPAELSLSVQTADGSPASGGTVMLAPDGAYALRRDLIRFGMVGSNGLATFKGVAPIDYKIFAWADVDTNLAQVPEFRKFLESRASSLTLQPGEHRSMTVPLIPADLIDEAKSKMQ